MLAYLQSEQRNNCSTFCISFPDGKDVAIPHHNLVIDRESAIRPTCR